MQKNDYILIPSLGNGVYKIKQILSDYVIINYDRDTTMNIPFSKIGQVMKAYI